MNLSIRDIYNVETDSEDWPKGLSTESKAWLRTQVRERLSIGPCELWIIYDYVRHRPNPPADFKRAVLLDWIYGAVERACRDVATPIWKLGETVSHES